MKQPTTADLTQHKWAFVLRDLVEKHGIVVPDPGTEHGRRLVRVLGATLQCTCARHAPDPRCPVHGKGK